jgi:hypothetical protein
MGSRLPCSLVGDDQLRAVGVGGLAAVEARGGLLRRGLAVERAVAALVTNVAACPVRHI